MAIFVFALAFNIKLTLDGPFLMLSESAIASTTNTTTSTDGGSSAGGPYTYLAKLTSKSEYGRVAEFETGCKIPIDQIPIGITCTYTIKDKGIVGETGNCTFWLTSKCDQSKVGYFPVIASCTPCE